MMLGTSKVLMGYKKNVKMAKFTKIILVTKKYKILIEKNYFMTKII